jgi:RNA polymerase sigma-70 factor, ECF subfamily
MMDAVPSTPAFETLWLDLHEPLCRFVCSRTANVDDAEDILQDVFLRAYHHLGTVRDPERLQSWVYQIARRRLIDHYRSRRQWVDLPETLPGDAEQEDETGEPLLASLRDVVDGLPESYREALVLTDLQGMAQQDLAGRLGISLSGAKSRVQRARQKVKETLARCYQFEVDVRGGLMDYSRYCCC